MSDNENKYYFGYEGIPEEALSEICAMFLCSCNVAMSPWKVRKTIIPKEHERNATKERLLRLAEEANCGLSRIGKSLTLFYTRKSIVLFLLSSCGLTSKDTYRIPDFVTNGTDLVKSRFLSGLCTELFIDETGGEMKAIFTESESFAKDLQAFLENRKFKTKLIFRKADGKRIKHDRYIVAFA